MISGIAIVGGNGSGKTTLGEMLANTLGYKHLDVEDYYFGNRSSSFSNPRSKEEVQQLLLEDMHLFPNFVFSSVGGDMGDEINKRYDLVIYINAPLDIRINRVKARSIEKYGDRVLLGGDMYESEQAFFHYVAMRSLDKLDQWLNSINCPVLYLDGTDPLEINVAHIKQYIASLG